LIWVGCARPGAPIGGPVDRVGPQVVATTPESFAVLNDFDGLIQLQFDERISETVSSGTLQETVKISPMLGDIKVTHGSRSLEVEMEGGFPDDMVYRVTVLPRIRDLFQNAMPYPFEFLFSTGAEMVPSVSAGLVTDGITLRPLGGTTVLATTDFDTELDSVKESELRHIAITDSSGVYAFRYLPAGDYSIIAFVDENRNNNPELTEPVARSYLIVTANDTVFSDMRVLRPDSTPPELSAVGVVDSLTLLIEFDDYLNPEQDLAESVSTTFSSDFSTGLGIAEILSEHEYNLREVTLSDALSSVDSGDISLSPDSTEKVNANESKIPSRNVYLILIEPISLGVTYEIAISGLENVNGTGLWGGVEKIMLDSLEIPGDTLRLFGSVCYE